MQSVNAKLLQTIESLRSELNYKEAVADGETDVKEKEKNTGEGEGEGGEESEAKEASESDEKQNFFEILQFLRGERDERDSKISELSGFLLKFHSISLTHTLSFFLLLSSFLVRDR